MGKYTFFDRFLDFISGLSFKIFIWSSRTTADEYWYSIYQQEIVAGYGMHYYQKYRVNEAIVLKCFVHDNKVYQITERP